MKTARLVDERTWEFVDMDEPVPRPGQMLVRLEQVAVCGSDIPDYVGVHPGFPKPTGGTGHEGIGRVISCPSGHYSEGERVLLWGFDRHHGLFQELVLTFDEGLLRLPGDARPERVLMAQLLGTVLRPFRRLGNIINQRAVVIGLGPTGQLFTSVLRNLGARDIVGIDPLDWRRDMARQMGATEVIDPGDMDPIEAVQELTGGAMADIVVEAVGDGSTYATAMALSRRGGTVIGFGVPDKEVPDGVLDLPLMTMQRKEINLVMTVNAGANPYDDYAAALDWIVQGRIDVLPLITHILPFAQIQRAFELFADRPSAERPIKVVLQY
ncbi:MAG: zinc-binding dehydrogenase [bacterium]|nr:zinc-binding dehydrogenase [bacterium]